MLKKKTEKQNPWSLGKFPSPAVRLHRQGPGHSASLEVFFQKVSPVLKEAETPLQSRKVPTSVWRSVGFRGCIQIPLFSSLVKDFPSFGVVQNCMLMYFEYKKTHFLLLLVLFWILFASEFFSSTKGCL